LGVCSSGTGWVLARRFLYSHPAGISRLNRGLMNWDVFLKKPVQLVQPAMSVDFVLEAYNGARIRRGHGCGSNMKIGVKLLRIRALLQKFLIFDLVFVSGLVILQACTSSNFCCPGGLQQRIPHGGPRGGGFLPRADGVRHSRPDQPRCHRWCPAARQHWYREDRSQAVTGGLPHPQWYFDRSIRGDTQAEQCQASQARFLVGLRMEEFFSTSGWSSPAFTGRRNS